MYPCPNGFLAGYFCYGTRRHLVGLPPKWIRNLLQKGVFIDDEAGNESEVEHEPETEESLETMQSASTLSDGSPDESQESNVLLEETVTSTDNTAGPPDEAAHSMD